MQFLQRVSAIALVFATNRQRAAYGLGPLRLNDRLSLAASDRVDDMLRKRYFDHVSPDGVIPFTWVAKPRGSRQHHRREPRRRPSEC